MDKFLKEYHLKSIRDDGAYMSEEAKSFFRKMKAFVKRALPDFIIEKWSVNHYDVSFFLVKHDSCGPIYVSYNLPRGEFPIDIDRSDPMFGVMYRRAIDTNDYSGKGGTNHFCSLANFAEAFKEKTMSSPNKKKYKITHTETLVDYFYVEAENEQDAIDVFREMVDNGECDLGRVEMVDSSDVATLVEDEEENNEH